MDISSPSFSLLLGIIPGLQACYSIPPLFVTVNMHLKKIFKNCNLRYNNSVHFPHWSKTHMHKYFTKKLSIFKLTFLPLISICRSIVRKKNFKTATKNKHHSSTSQQLRIQQIYHSVHNKKTEKYRVSKLSMIKYSFF